VLLRRNHFAFLEEFICFLVYHQQLGLVPSGLDGSHNVPMLLALHAHPIHLWGRAGVTSIGLNAGDEGGPTQKYYAPLPTEF
jgi:hypothetical protein